MNYEYNELEKNIIRAFKSELSCYIFASLFAMFVLVADSSFLFKGRTFYWIIYLH